MNTPEPVTIGVDPSLSGTGYCILQGDALLAYGTIRTAPDDGNDAERNAVIVAGLLNAVKECPERVTLLGVETQFAGGGGEGFRARAGAAMRVAAVRGAVSMLGPMLSIPVVEVSPAEGKRALTGSGKATKKQMQAAVLRDYGVSLAQDSADACGIALSARQIVAGRAPARKHVAGGSFEVTQKTPTGNIHLGPREEATDGLPTHVKDAISRGRHGK